jgi:uncharacterized alkaline shock family protein YloU
MGDSRMEETETGHGTAKPATPPASDTEAGMDDEQTGNPPPAAGETAAEPEAAQPPRATQPQEETVGRPPDEDTALSETEYPRVPAPRPERRRKRRKVLHLEQERGALEVSDAVVATIVQKEGRVEGVVDIRGRSLGMKVRRIFGRGRMVNGIYVEVHNAAVSLEVTIAVRYGASIPDLAQRVRTSIAEKIEYITGCKVEAVNIVVDRIVMQE